MAWSYSRSGNIKIELINPNIIGVKDASKAPIYLRNLTSRIAYTITKRMDNNNTPRPKLPEKSTSDSLECSGSLIFVMSKDSFR